VSVGNAVVAMWSPARKNAAVRECFTFGFRVLLKSPVGEVDDPILADAAARVGSELLAAIVGERRVRETSMTRKTSDARQVCRLVELCRMSREDKIGLGPELESSVSGCWLRNTTSASPRGSAPTVMDQRIFESLGRLASIVWLAHLQLECAPNRRSRVRRLT
jgi:hypothetical protein